MSRTRHHHHRRMRWGGTNEWNHSLAERPIRVKSNRMVRMLTLATLDTLVLPHPKHNQRGFFY